MRPKNAGNAQVIGVLAVFLLIAGAAAWLLMAPSEPNSGGGGEDPVVEGDPAGGDPSAGTYVDNGDNNQNPAEIGTPERVEVNPGGDQNARGPAGGVRGSVVDQNGNAISGAQIFLTSRAAGQLFSTQPSEPAENAARLKDQTNKDGRYYFAELSAGKEYDLWVNHPEYGPEAGPPVVVIGGEIMELSPIVLRSGYALTGTVVDTAGNPLPATVEFYMQDMNFLRAGSAEELRAKDRASGRLKIVETDGNGEFRVEHLGQGIWSAQAYSEGFASNIVRAITLVDGTEPAPLQIELDTEHLITGVVVTTAGDPVAGAAVQVARQKPRPVITGMTESLEDGSFVVNRLPAGSYGVLVTMEGFTPQRVGRTEAGADPLRIVLVAKAEIRGRVVQPNGSPVPEFSLELLTPLRGKVQYRKLGKVFDFKDPNGDFTIIDADPMEYVILARAPGFAPTYSAPFTATRGEEGAGIVDIVMSKGASITGTIVDATTGVGVPGAEVSLHMADYQVPEGDSMFGDVFQDLGNIPATKVRTGADGSFRIDNAYVDVMTLVAQKDGFLPATTTITTAPERELKIGRLDMRPGGTISGTAVDGDGKPLAGGSVNITRPGEAFQRSVTLDARGRFSFGSLRSGQYELVAFPPSDGTTFLFPDESGKQTIYVDEGRTKTVELKISK